MQTYLSLSETARLLGVSVSAVRHWVDTGQLEGIRDRRGVRFVAEASARQLAATLGRTSEEGELFTTSEFAQALGIRPRRLIEWANAGLVPAVIHRHAFRFEPSAFTALGRPIPERPKRLTRRWRPVLDGADGDGARD